MQENEEHEFVVFEDRVGVIVKANKENMKDKITYSKNLLRDLNKIKVIATQPDAGFLNLKDIAAKIGIDEIKTQILIKFDRNLDLNMQLGNIQGRFARARDLKDVLFLLQKSTGKEKIIAIDNLNKIRKFYLRYQDDGTLDPDDLWMEIEDAPGGPTRHERVFAEAASLGARQSARQAVEQLVMTPSHDEIERRPIPSLAVNQEKTWLALRQAA